MGRYKTKRQAIEEANKRMIKEDTDEFKRQPGSMADSLWKSKHKEWEEETDPYDAKVYDAGSDEWVEKDENDVYDKPITNDWGQLKSRLYDYEKGLGDEELEQHIKNLKSHLQEVIYVLNNR